MNKSEKIQLIHEIRDSLSLVDWNEIEFVLDQFDIPGPPSDFSGVKTDYVYARVGKALDIHLVDLARHLGIKTTVSINVDRIPSFWKNDDFRMFISHISKHKHEAQGVKDELQACGITGFVAHSDIEPSLEWQLEIELALSTCDAFIALLTPKFNESQWTDQEVGFAVARNIPVFPVNMGMLPYGFLAKYQALPYKDDVKELAKLIYNLLLKNERTQKKLGYGVLRYLDDADSFSEANDRSLLLTDIEFWDKPMIQKLRSIHSSNSQVRGGWGSSSRVTGILSRYEVDK